MDSSFDLKNSMISTPLVNTTDFFSLVSLDRHPTVPNNDDVIASFFSMHHILFRLYNILLLSTHTTMYIIINRRYNDVNII